METLLLKVSSSKEAGTTRLDWSLTFSNGEYLTDHSVTLNDASAPSEAGNLLLSLRRQAISPDGAAEAVAVAGHWISDTLLGPVATEIAAQAPVTVEVRVPPSASTVMHWPLELGYALDPLSRTGEQLPLSQQNVSFVYEIVGDEPDQPPQKKDPIGQALRILTVFCEHAAGSTSTLHRESRRLTSRIDRIAAGNKAIKLGLLAYGVTDKKLEETLEEGAGWDVVHVSGYGLHAGLTLHGQDGVSALLPTPNLAKLLRRIKNRLKLVILLDRDPGELVAPDEVCDAGQNSDGTNGSGETVIELAKELVRRLDCAVLAVRCPASDQFATGFVPELYTNLLQKGQSLPAAVQLATEKTIGSTNELRPLFSIIGPTLFGKRAVDLRIEAPDDPVLDFSTTRLLKMTGVPRVPDTFAVPRESMERASASLQPDSDLLGVVLFGEAAVGKTLCAAELVRLNEKLFPYVVWYQLSEPTLVRAAFDELVRVLDRRLRGLDMAHRVDTEQGLLDFLPDLTQQLTQRSVLLVLDNLQALLTPEGAWRHPWFEHVVRALLAHDGDSRVILTSRQAPSGLERVLIEELVAHGST